MLIETRNIGDKIMSRLAVCGELSLANIPKGYERDMTRKMQRDGLLTINKKRETVRIKSPLGIEYLRKYDIELYEHYMGLTNNHVFKSTDRDRLRYREIGRVGEIMLASDITIDNIKLEERSNIFGRENYDNVIDSVLGGTAFFGYKKFADEILEMVAGLADEKNYFSGKFVKSNGTHKQITPSKITGIYFSNRRSYLVYYISELNTKMVINSEKGMIAWLRRLHEKAYGLVAMNEQATESPNGEAIVFYNTEEELEKMLYPSTNRHFSPKLFSRYYMIPDNEYRDMVLAMIGHKPFLVDEFLTCDYSLIERLKNKNEPTSVLCYEWQTDFLRKHLKGYPITLRVITKEQEQEIVNRFK